MRSVGVQIVRVAVSVAMVGGVISLLSAEALAQGGTTVETAPLIISGQTVSGNTSSDSVITQDLHSDTECTSNAELWRMNLVGGDEVLLKGQEEMPASHFDIEMFPPGVNDAELFGSSNIPGIQAGSLDSGLSFYAGPTGTWLVLVASDCGGSPGPYQMTATIYPSKFVAGGGGGTTVENAPYVTPSSIASGNTASDQVITQDLKSDVNCTFDAELWKLHLMTGEHVLLQGQEELPASNFDIEAFPPGVNDAELFGTNSISGIQAGSISQGLSFYPGPTGTWLILVAPDCGGSSGPYQLHITIYPASFAVGNGGGTTIENAPYIIPGQTVSGNTSQDQVIAQDLKSDVSCTFDAELWKLNLHAGQHVLIQGRTELPASNFDIEAFPPGVNDAELFGTNGIQNIQAAALDQSLSFEANITGRWLLLVAPGCGGSAGPYQMTVVGPSLHIRPVVIPLTTKTTVFAATVILAIRCERVTCRGMISLTTKTVGLGTGNYYLAANKTSTFAVGVNATCIELLMHASKHTILATETATVIGGATATRTIVLHG